MRLQIYIVAFAIAATSAHAQSIAGKWSVTWDSDITMDHDTAVVKKRSTTTLELARSGDSVTGVWGGGPDSGTRLRGTYDGKALRLTTGTNEREVKVNGQTVKMKVRWDITGAMQGSKLAGALFIYVGDRPPPARRWEAIRAP
jgi:hypothetical protein